MRNGSNGVEELEEVFEGCGYIFRHFPDATVACLRWQAGRSVCVEVDTLRGWVLDEVYELVAWASTSEQLMDKLSAL
jgi:hypothetical protein